MHVLLIGAIGVNHDDGRLGRAASGAFAANSESMFKEMLATLIADTFTPVRWENYVPYNERVAAWMVGYSLLAGGG
jgi:hypothetical protein